MPNNCSQSQIKAGSHPLSQHDESMPVDPFRFGILAWIAFANLARLIEDPDWFADINKLSSIHRVSNQRNALTVALLHILRACVVSKAALMASCCATAHQFILLKNGYSVACLEEGASGSKPTTARTDDCNMLR